MEALQHNQASLAAWKNCLKVDESLHFLSLSPIRDLDRVVVVTGVSSGIGLAITKALIGHQCHVVGSVRKEADAKRLQAEFEEYFTPLLFDVTDEAAVRHAALYVRALMNGHTLMGLVTNAGIHVGLYATGEMPIGKLRQQLEVNLVAQVTVIQAFLPLLGTDLSLRGRPGKILNNSSIFGSYALLFTTAYAASKAGLNAISEGLHRELRPFDIDVVVIAPGPIETEIWEDAVGDDQQVGHNKGPFDPFIKNFQTNANALTKKPRWFPPTSTVGEKVWKILNTRRPAMQYVITPNWWYNWFAPKYLPGKLVTKEVARKFGLNKKVQRVWTATTKEETLDY